MAGLKEGIKQDPTGRRIEMRTDRGIIKDCDYCKREARKLLCLLVCPECYEKLTEKQETTERQDKK